MTLRACITLGVTAIAVWSGDLLAQGSFVTFGAGPTWSSLTGFQTPQDQTLLGATAHIRVSVPTSDVIGLEFGLQFTHKGFARAASAFNTGLTTFGGTARLSYLEVPIALTIAVPARGTLRAVALLGFSPAFHLDGDLRPIGVLAPLPKSIDAGTVVGAGLRLQASGSVWEMDIRYTAGTASAFQSGGGLGFGSSGQNRSVAVSLGTGFRL